MVFFSVIIPCYNKEKYIQNTIESVLKQTFTDFEIVIVNDGSTDKSEKIIKSFSDSRLKLINKTNEGVSIARNTGIKNAKGKFIAFLDADDFWGKSHLKSAYELIKQFKDYGLYCLKYARVKKSEIIEANFYKIPSEDNKIYEIKDFFKRCSLADNISTSSSVIIPKKLFNSELKFPENINRGEDRYVWSRIALNNKVILLNKITSYYRLNNTGITSKENNDYDWIFENYFETLSEEEYSYQSKSHIEMLLISRKLSFFPKLIKERNYKMIGKLFKKTLRYPLLYKKLLINTLRGMK